MPLKNHCSSFALALLIIVLSLSCNHSFAQYTIRGVVVDDNNVEIEGVTIKTKHNPTIGTTTDRNGGFVLKIPTNDTTIVVVSMTGMVSQTFTFTPLTNNQIRVTLKEKPQLLESVVVTATRTPKLLSETPIVTRLITHQDINNSDVGDIQDLLQNELPGVEFTFSMNQQTSINMQGFGGNSVLFLVDGERMAGETLDNIDYSRLSLDNVERVEIVKGAASSLYGSNAIGGVVNIISEDTKKPFSLNLNARYGSVGEKRMGATLGLRRGRLGSSTSFRYDNADSLRLAESGSITKIYAHHSYNIKERLTFDISDRLKLTARAGYFFREREPQATSFDRYRDFTGGIKEDYRISDNSNIMVSYLFDQYDKSDYAILSRKDVRDYSNVQHTYRTLYNQTIWGNNTLTLGGDFMRDYLMSYQFVDDGSYIQYTADAFAQWDWTPIDHFNIVAALRYDYYSEAQANHLSPKINLMYKHNDLTYRASYSNGFRAPTLKEMYMNFDMASIFMIYGNADLRPEVSHNLNATLEYNHRNYNVTLLGFYNNVSSRITTVWVVERNGMVYTNLAPINIHGLDLSATARFDNGIGMRFSYVYTHEGADENGLRSSSTRPHTATLRLDYTYRWAYSTTSLALNGRLLSAVTCDEYLSYTDMTKTQKVTYPGYMMWKLTLNQRFKRGITLTFAVDNLLDYKPKVYYSNSPATIGRTYAIGLSLDVDNILKL